MISRTISASWLVIGALAFALLCNCAWESGGGDDDAGQQDGNDGQYPAGPYGTDYGDTVENFRVTEALCGGASARGRALYAASFLDYKATLVSVHAGWCSACKSQSASLEDDFYQVYADQGFQILLILFQDDQGASSEQALLDYACYYKDHYDMSFYVAIDPDADVMGQYFRPTEAGTPLNMLLDGEMVIRYKVEGTIPDVLEGNIEALLSDS